MYNKIADFISVVLNPFPVLLFSVVAVFYNFGLETNTFVQLIVFVLLFGFGLPLLLLLSAIKTKTISDFDISKRNERRIPLLILLILIIFDTVVINYIAGFNVSKIFMFFGIWSAGFTVITNFWKISGHSSVNTLAAFLIIYYFGLQWWPVLSIIPLVSWSRVVRGDHTLMQVVIGFVYSALLFVLFFRFSPFF